MYKHINTGNSNSYERKGLLSAPIFMDNVACYGSEDKLIDCSYHTDTTEDNHNNDIWIECDVTDTVITLANTSGSLNNTTTMVALAMSAIALGIGILVIVFLTGCQVCRHKSKTHMNGRLVKLPNANTIYCGAFIISISVFTIRMMIQKVPEIIFKSRRKFTPNRLATQNLTCLM